MKARWSERSRLMASMVYDAGEHSGSALRENQVKRPAAYKKFYIYIHYKIANIQRRISLAHERFPATRHAGCMEPVRNTQKKDGRFIQSRNPVKMQVLRLPNCRELEKGANRVVGDAACKMSLPRRLLRRLARIASLHSINDGCKLKAHP